MSEVAKVFQKLPMMFQRGSVKNDHTFYFSLDDEEKWTVSLTAEKCVVEKGNTGSADCFFKASPEMFLDVWNGRYTPGIKDFMSGTIKSNNPLLLKEFIAAFKKE